MEAIIVQNEKEIAIFAPRVLTCVYYSAKTKIHIDMKRQKQIYDAPSIQVVEMKMEAVVCGSGEGKDPWENDD